MAMILCVWLAPTGQARRDTAIKLVTAALGAAYLAASLPWFRPWREELLLGATALSVPWFVLWMAAIRCRACGRRIVWWLANQRNPPCPIFHLPFADACPACGDPGAARRWATVTAPGRVASLRVDAGERGHRLIRLDDSGAEVGVTHHATLAEAMRQGEHEHGSRLRWRGTAG